MEEIEDLYYSADSVNKNSENEDDDNDFNENITHVKTLSGGDISRQNITNAGSNNLNNHNSNVVNHHYTNSYIKLANNEHLQDGNKYFSLPRCWQPPHHHLMRSSSLNENLRKKCNPKAMLKYGKKTLSPMSLLKQM